MGSYAAPKAKVVSFQVDYCTQDYLEWKFPGTNKTCKTKKEADEIIGAIQVYLPVLTQYFDQNEFEESPIKNLINNDIYLTLHPNIANIYYYKFSKNFVELADTWFSDMIPPNELIYYDLRLTQLHPGLPDIKMGLPLISVEFQLDENIVHFNRQV